MKIWVLQFVNYQSNDKDEVHLFSTKEKAIEYFKGTMWGEDLDEDQMNELINDGGIEIDPDYGVELFEKDLD